MQEFIVLYSGVDVKIVQQYRKRGLPERSIYVANYKLKDIFLTNFNIREYFFRIHYIEQRFGFRSDQKIGCV